MSSRYQDLERVLQSKRIKPTVMRLLVLEELLSQDAAISLSALEDRMQPADRVTIYRTLKLFEDKGLVHSIIDDTTSPKFSLCDDSCDQFRHQDMHVHFVCSKCHQTFCLPDSRIPPIEIPPNFQLDSFKVIAKGLCDRCQVYLV